MQQPAGIRIRGVRWHLSRDDDAEAGDKGLRPETDGELALALVFALGDFGEAGGRVGAREERPFGGFGGA